VVLENTFSEAFWPHTQCGFAMPKFRKVSGGMGLPARMAARLHSCFQHPAHPPPRENG
jgi:hypothetical protein